MITWRASDKKVYVETTNDGSIEFRKKGRFNLMPATFLMRVSNIGKCDLIFVLKSILTLFKNGSKESVVEPRNSIGTTVIDWDSNTFTLESKGHKEGITLHMLDIDGLVDAVHEHH